MKSWFEESRITNPIENGFFKGEIDKKTRLHIGLLCVMLKCHLLRSLLQDHLGFCLRSKFKNSYKCDRYKQNYKIKIHNILFEDGNKLRISSEIKPGFSINQKALDSKICDKVIL